MALLHMNFESNYLRMNTDIGVILPDRPREEDPGSFYGHKQNFPVLWLLHGALGDYSDWIRKSNIETYACERNLAVVMPSGYNSYYGSWPHYSGGLMPSARGLCGCEWRLEDIFRQRSLYPQGADSNVRK